jgi:Right handed beta helix region
MNRPTINRPIRSRLDLVRKLFFGTIAANITFGTFCVFFSASAWAQSTNTATSVLSLSPVAPSSASSVREFYIATNGSDSNDGSKEHPFATLEKARDTMRQIKKHSGLPSGGITLWVRGGTYFLDRTFTLEGEDSGSTGSPVVFRGFPGERVIISGGRPITGFVTYQGEILKTDVGPQGLKGVYFRQLFLEDKRQPLARYPNADLANPITGGWAYVDGVLVPMYKDIPGEDKHTLHAKAADFHHWSHPEEAEVFIYPRYNWWNDIVTVKSVDETTRTLTLSKDCSYAIRPGDRYFIQNLLEELDAPGEWYLDRKNSTLYFWPPKPLQGKTLVAPALANLITLGQGASDITLRGFEIGCCSGNAVEMRGTTNCLIAACILRNIGDKNGNAISINGGKENGAVGNDILDIGRSGIVLQGGDRITLTPTGNYADNNHISHFGVCFKQGVGVEMSSCGSRASHNLIHDGPRFGILFWGPRHIVEYNHLHHLCLETEDTGAMYTGGRDWISARGSVLRYNLIHDIYGFGQESGKWITPFFAWGIYLDDNTGGVDVIGNVISNCSRSCLHLHDGRDNLIQNNIFVEGGKEQVTYSGWITSDKYWTRFHDDLVKGHNAIKDQPSWKGMRNIGISPDESVLTNGQVMIGNQFFCNIIDYRTTKSSLYCMRNVPFERNTFDYDLISHHGIPVTNSIRLSDTNAAKPPATWEGWQQLGNDRHSVIADPLFADPVKGDYTIRPESPAYSLGFRQIPMEKIGPYADELRATWPIN